MGWHKLCRTCELMRANGWCIGGRWSIAASFAEKRSQALGVLANTGRAK